MSSGPSIPPTGRAVPTKARVAALDAEGKSPAAIAAEVGRTARHVRRVLEELRKGGAPAAAPVEPPVVEPVAIHPFAEICRSLAEQHHVAAQARGLAASTRQDAVKVAALKLLAALARERIELLAHFGALPTGPAWMTELQAGAAWRALSDIAGAHGLDLDELREQTQVRIAEHIRHAQSDGLLQLAPLTLVPRGAPEREAA